MQPDRLLRDVTGLTYDLALVASAPLDLTQLRVDLCFLSTILGLFILGGLGLQGSLALINKRFNQRPPRPYYTDDPWYGRCLELSSDGTYKSCLRFLKGLESEFGAKFNQHLEYGHSNNFGPGGVDKEKGYWNIEVFGQAYFLMRVRGDGMCLWGPKPPESIDGFLKITTHVGAQRFLTWQERVAAWTPLLRWVLKIRPN